MLLGLTGIAQSGKSTVADVLVEQFGFRNIGFADKLRELGMIISPDIEVDVEEHSDKNIRYCGEYQSYRDLVSTYGYEEAKRNLSVREFLQNLGVGCREIFGQDCWVNLVAGQLVGGDVVIPDVRYQNEAHLIRESGGYIWKIHREGIQPPNNHISEQGLPDDLIDGHFHNNCTLEELPTLAKNSLEFMGYESKSN